MARLSSKSRSHFLYLTIFTTLIGATALLAHEDEAPDMDIRQFVRDSEFVFKGRVEHIDHRFSEPTTIIDPTTGEPDLADGSDLPHSFVRFAIERIYKGKAPQPTPGGPSSDMLTLRFIGGPAADDPEAVLFVDTHPFFDIGDRSILFVQANEFKYCPLVRGGYGRLYLLPHPDRPTGPNMVFNNYGHEVVHYLDQSGSTVPREELAFGQFHIIPEINKVRIGQVDIERAFSEPNDEFSLPGMGEPLPGVPKGPQFDEAGFDTFLDEIVAEVHTREELNALPPINSGDPDRPFVIGILYQDEPNLPDETPPPEPDRAWLADISPERRDAILEQERVEAQLLDLSGGDPVLPSNDCEMRILVEGPIEGDISGPEGKPDCRVDFFDFAVIALNWLECNDPTDPLCEALDDSGV